VRFQWSVPEPTRIALMNSLAERFNQSQKDFAVQIEYVPQAQARQKLISSIAGGSPPDLCQVWDNWVGQFNGMGAVEDITARAKSWKHYADVAPTAWQTVTINDQIVSLPLAVTLDGIYYRTDRLKELGLKEPTPDWTWDEFLALAKAFTKADKNQYGYGMRGGGTWALLYPSEFAYANGAEVLKDGKVVINSKAAVDALSWYLDLALKHKVTPPSAATDGFVEIVETFGRGVTSMYQHNSGSSGQQKKNVGADNFATLPLPFGPAKKRASFWFSETLTMFKGAKQKEGAWQFMTFMLEDEQALPEVALNERIPVNEIVPKQHFTEPPGRFSEASLVKELERLGIGRPSTYASIISVLADRHYVLLEQRRFTPTPLGETVAKIMVMQFPDIFNVEFTSGMEGELDKVEAGSMGWQRVLEEFWEPFSVALDAANVEELIAQAHDLSMLATERCPKDGGKLIAKGGIFGPYLACEHRPECTFTRPLGRDRLLSFNEWLSR